MADESRLEALRRRVERDPSSIAFAQLAEEYRRAGDFRRAVDVCRAGLAIHPAYASARVTLGRALVQLGQLDEARKELEAVLASAPDNAPAARALEDLRQSGVAAAPASSAFAAVSSSSDRNAAASPDVIKAQRTIAALEQWLAALHVARANRSA